ncbi:hypothetical protein [uncultured Algibacter sp.]|uniref:hypothetical protein n=1 Tax=uncultured Algibacter sp. TaxID=298659 RepID=UPI002636DAC2|nr:hypothetical protein [uncultured Algibacter sp.]
MQFNRSKFMIVLAISIIVLLILNIYMIFNLFGADEDQKKATTELVLRKLK